MDALKLKSRVMSGIKAGFAAGGVMNLAELIAYHIFRQPKVRSTDWLSIILIKHKPFTWPQYALAHACHLLFTTLLGGMFTGVVPNAAGEKPVLKGWLWASAGTLLTQSLIAAARLPLLSKLGWGERAKHFTLVSIYGLVLGGSLHLMKNAAAGGEISGG